MAEETEMEITELELDEENVAQLLKDDEEKKNEQIQEEDGQEKPDEGQEETGPRLFIGGLNSKTKDKELRAYFEKYGKLIECHIARKKPRDGGQKTKSRGFGFITMATKEATDAILNDTHVINDKIVSAMISKPPDAPERKLRLCVSNLDINTTEDTIREHFSQFGTLTECSLAKEQVDGKTVSRGIGFITLTTEDEVKAVLDASVDGRQTLDGKSVVVRRVVNHTQFYAKDRKLWFGGLDKEKTTESDLTEHFSTFGTVEECVVVRDPPETEGGECKSKGYGYLTMATVDEMGAILKHSKLHKIHGKVLIFNRALQRPTDSDVDFYPVKQIYVSGLKDTPVLSADNLRMYFNTHANVKYVTMMKDQGVAKITLDSAADVEKLALMRDHLIQKHWLTVRKADKVSLGETEKAGKSDKSAIRPKGGMGTGRANPQKHGAFRGGMSGGPRKNQSPRQGVRGHPGAFNYHDQPMQGGFGGGHPAPGGYYGDDLSSYGPVRGHGGSGTGGWVYVENLYGGQEDKGAYQQQKGPKKGFRGKGRGKALSSSYGDYAGGLGGGYGDDSWGEGLDMPRGRGGWPY